MVRWLPSITAWERPRLRVETPRPGRGVKGYQMAKRVRDEYPKQPGAAWLGRGYSFLDWSLACHLAAPRAIPEPEGKWEAELSRPCQDWLAMRHKRQQQEAAEKRAKAAEGKERSRKAYYKLRGWFYSGPLL